MTDGLIGGVVRQKSVMVTGGNYTANMSIVIIDGGSLEIGANATISFASSRAIVVKNSGRLKIAGPTTLCASIASKFWNGIHVLTSNTTFIDGSIIRDATVGLTAAPQSSGMISIDNTEFDHVMDGIQLESDSTLAVVSLTSVKINSTGHGLSARYFSGRLTMTNSTITCKKSGLSAYYAHHIFLADNMIDAGISGSRSLDLVMGIYRQDMPQKNMILMGNKVTCLVSCLYLDSQNTNIRVDNNSFRGVGSSHTSSQALLVMTGANSFSIKGNIFRDWNSPNTDAVFVRLQQYNGNHTVNLNNNLFREIKARRILNLDFLGSATPANIANAFEETQVVLDSTFHIDNWPKSCGSAPCTLVGNIFNSSLPLGKHHIGVSVSMQLVASIDASLSYWGSDDESKVIESIYDGSDSAGLTTIDYLPYLLTPDPAGNRRSVT
jgi:hypothetical protein